MTWQYSQKNANHVITMNTENLTLPRVLGTEKEAQTRTQTTEWTFLLNICTPPFVSNKYVLILESNYLYEFFFLQVQINLYDIFYNH